MLLASAALIGLLQQPPQTVLAELRPAAVEQPSDNDRVQSLLAEREQARHDRDFARSDALRAALKAEGFLVEDTPSGPVLRPVEKELA
ncbi:hypothetical protein MBH78_21485 [Oceanimonas sp. NS1]|nr:hypothetical protein [Oceanimonas sp. NS1]